MIADLTLTSDLYIAGRKAVSRVPAPLGRPHQTNQRAVLRLRPELNAELGRLSDALCRAADRGRTCAPAIGSQCFMAQLPTAGIIAFYGILKPPPPRPVQPDGNANGASYQLKDKRRPACLVCFTNCCQWPVSRENSRPDRRPPGDRHSALSKIWPCGNRPYRFLTCCAQPKLE